MPRSATESAIVPSGPPAKVVRSSHRRGRGIIYPAAASIMSAPFSAMMITGALVLPLTIDGMTDASITLRRSMPRRRKSASPPADAALVQVPTGHIGLGGRAENLPVRQAIAR